MASQQTPSRRIRMTTRLAPDVVLQQLARTLEKQPPVLPLQPRPRTWLFAGTITGNHFAICRIPAGKRIFENQLDGIVEPAPQGATITLTIRPYDSEVIPSSVGLVLVIFVGLVVIGMPLYFAAIGQLPLNCGLFPLVVGVIMGVCFYALPSTPATFDLDALTALDHLRTVFAVETEVQLDESTSPPP